jgi:hypothetical protein
MSASVVFITGWCPNETEYKNLMAYEEKFYKGKLPANMPLYVDRWDKNPAAAIKSKFPTGDLVIVGFSFGGQKSIEVCAELARPIKKLILLDPVDYHNPNVPNTAGFTLPDNVLAANCYYRLPRDMPWSGHVVKAKCEFYNKKYTPKPVTPPAGMTDTKAIASYIETVQHGEYVWSEETINAVRSAL